MWDIHGNPIAEKDIPEVEKAMAFVKSMLEPPASMMSANTYERFMVAANDLRVAGHTQRSMKDSIDLMFEQSPHKDEVGL